MRDLSCDENAGRARDPCDKIPSPVLRYLPDVRRGSDHRGIERLSDRASTPKSEGRAEVTAHATGPNLTRRKFVQGGGLGAGAVMLAGPGYGTARRVSAGRAPTPRPGAGSASDTVNVMEYGAVGDGSRDDTSAIASAVSKAGELATAHGARARVVSEPGKQHKVNYTHTGPGLAERVAILLPSHVWLDGLNLITPDPGETGKRYYVVIAEASSSVTDVGVLNCTINGNAPANAQTTENGHGSMMFQYGSDLFVYNNYCLNFRQTSGPYILPAVMMTRVRVLDNTFDLCYGAALKLISQRRTHAGMTDARVEGNFLRNNLGVPDYEAAECLLCYPVPEAGPASLMSDVSILGNHIYPTGAGIILTGGESFDVGYNTIDNSMFSKTVTGIGSEYPNAGNFRLSNSRIHDNLIYGNTNPGIAVHYWTDVDVGNNLIASTGSRPIPNITTYGQSRNCMIANNHFSPSAGLKNSYASVRQSAGEVGLVVRGNKGWNDVPLPSMGGQSRVFWPGQSSGGNVTRQPRVPASGRAHTNDSGYDAVVYVTGGTVSAVALDGVTTGLTSGPFEVPANHTITVTYTSAPGWVWIWS